MVISTSTQLDENAQVITYLGHAAGHIDNASIYACLTFQADSGDTSIYPPTGKTREFIDSLRNATDELERKLNDLESKGGDEE